MALNPYAGGLRASPVRRRRVNEREVFEVRVESRVDIDAVEISWRSQVFSLHRSMRIARTWRRDVADPQAVVNFIEELVGRTLQNWAELGVDGRTMAEACSPAWDAAIYEFMESLERDARYARGADRLQYPDFGYRSTVVDSEATKKARATLLRHLNEAQTASFEKDKAFLVEGKDGKTYTIKHARSFNVVGPNGDKYCGQLQDCPIEDQMLAQKLLLEHEPEKFFKNANVAVAQPTYDTYYGAQMLASHGPSHINPARWATSITGYTP